MYYMFVYDEVIKKMDRWTDVMTFKWFISFSFVFIHILNQIIFSAA